MRSKYFEFGLAPWDVAAGVLLVREAGGFVGDISGQPYVLGGPSILASNAGLRDAMVEILTFGPMLRPKQANGSKYTPKTLAKAYPKGRFLAFSRDHVFALIDGKVQDWHEGRRYHIINVHQLKEKTT